jgi:hypothetical protein
MSESTGAAPNANKRMECYMARDLYFKCLDDSNENMYVLLRKGEIVSHNPCARVK